MDIPMAQLRDIEISRFGVFSEASPVRIAARTMAPQATASSTLMDSLRSLPLKKSDPSLTIRGIRVEPPARTISWTLDLLIFESRRDFSAASRVERKRSWQSSREQARVSEVDKSMPSKSERRLCGRGQGALGALAGGAESAEGT